MSGLAIWDQKAPTCVPCLSATQTAFQNDESFISSIENRVPPGAAIYQLPYMPFPEVPPLHNLQAYDHAIGYLHSHSLKWSYGLVKGRSGDLFFRALSAQPVERQVDVIRKLGFRGVYVDRRGYVDRGAEIEAALAHAIGHPPTLVSGSNQQVFFDLAEGSGKDTAPLPQGLSDDQIMERAGFIVDKLGVRYAATLQDGIDFSQVSVPTFLTDLRGLSSPEGWGRWSDATLSPSVMLIFAVPLPKHFVLHLRARAFRSDARQSAKVIVSGEERDFTPTATMSDFTLSFNNHRTANQIEIQYADSVSPHDLGMSDDTRKLGLGLKRLWIETPPQSGVHSHE